MKNTILVLLLLFVGDMFAQTNSETFPTSETDTVAAKDTTGEVLSFAEIMPVFPGGNKAFTKYLQENIVYPKEEKLNGKQGTVYVSFIINSDGSVSGVRLRKGVNGAPGLGEEAVRVITGMPDWSPGTMSGKPVRVEMTVPITFTLKGGRKKKR